MAKLKCLDQGVLTLQVEVLALAFKIFQNHDKHNQNIGTNCYRIFDHTVNSKIVLSTEKGVLLEKQTTLSGRLHAHH